MVPQLLMSKRPSPTNLVREAKIPGRYVPKRGSGPCPALRFGSSSTLVSFQTSAESPGARISTDGVIQELVAIDGADWHQEGGPTAGWSHGGNGSKEWTQPRPFGFATSWRVTTRTRRSWRRPCCRSSKPLKKVNGRLRLSTSKGFVVSPNGDTCLCTSKASAFENRDWNLLHLGVPR